MWFRKMHGAGNDFILVTDSNGDKEKNWEQRAVSLCSRHTGIGADGMVLSTLLSIAPPRIDVTCINADGSIATMCGNALRCAAWTAHQDHGFTHMRLTMAGREHQAHISSSGVWVTADVDRVELRRLQIVFKNRPLWFDSTHTGTEHVVTFVPDSESVDAETLGRLVRHHPELAPRGTNVNFLQVIGPQELRIRTYERGVEAETLSCGSGAVAGVVIAVRRGKISNRQTTVHNRSGTPLLVRPHLERPERSYWVGGPVTEIFRGELS
jgi:diaminopimelate epimerase